MLVIANQSYIWASIALWYTSCVPVVFGFFCLHSPFFGLNTDHLRAGTAAGVEPVAAGGVVEAAQESHRPASNLFLLKNLTCRPQKDVCVCVCVSIWISNTYMTIQHQQYIYSAYILWYIFRASYIISYKARIVYICVCIIYVGEIIRPKPKLLVKWTTSTFFTKTFILFHVPHACTRAGPTTGVEPVATGLPEAAQESADDGAPRGVLARVSVAARSYWERHSRTPRGGAGIGHRAAGLAAFGYGMCG